MIDILAGLAAVLLALVHVLAWRLRFLHGVPRSRWLSAAGGVSVAYVFVHILPDLAERQEEIRAASGPPVIGFLEHHVYLLALSGLAVFYGLEHLARRHSQDARSRQQPPEQGTALAEPEAPPGVFWIHIGSFTFYNALIGYLLVHREMPGLASLGTYALAMALHFVVNDYGLWEHHRRRYRHMGRWILAGAVVGGWVLGVTVVVHEQAIAALFALLAGSVVLNVLKEELPEERESRFWAFAAGCFGYAALLLAL